MRQDLLRWFSDLFTVPKLFKQKINSREDPGLPYNRDNPQIHTDPKLQSQEHKTAHCSLARVSPESADKETGKHQHRDKSTRSHQLLSLHQRLKVFHRIK